MVSDLIQYYHVRKSVITNRKRELIKERHEDCSEKYHHNKIMDKRQACLVNGFHKFGQRTIGRGYESIHEKQCTECDFVEWYSKNYHDYLGYIHTECLE